MNQLELLVEFASLVIYLDEQHAGHPKYDLGFLADRIGVNPVTAEWLISTLANLKTQRPKVNVATIERPGASDSDSVIVAYTEESLRRALAEENHIFHASPDDQQAAEDSDDDERIITDYGQVFIS